MASAVLGLLFVALCWLFATGRLPRDPVSAGERVVIAGSCLIVAAYFFRRAHLGRK